MISYELVCILNSNKTHIKKHRVTETFCGSRKIVEGETVGMPICEKCRVKFKKETHKDGY